MGRVSPSDPFRVIFVCTGNICRSPMAEVVFRDLAEHQGLGPLIVSTSAGTSEWHVGERADERTIDALDRRGYDGSQHRAKPFTAASFADNDLVVALDRSHERILRQWSRDEDQEGKIILLLTYDRNADVLDVPDPYYADTGTFDSVLAMIETATRGLFRQLEPALRSRRMMPRAQHRTLPQNPTLPPI
ncbi:low molecular weight protein-tyrosine-phosphatase [Microbacterium sp.]|uniref:low molecular weight protein-tyrosine-phosphatase n=1 Tax=Microbacterium sp. TaxID=51671 RepID=UPI003F9CF696